MTKRFPFIWAQNGLMVHVQARNHLITDKDSQLLLMVVKRIEHHLLSPISQLNGCADFPSSPKHPDMLTLAIVCDSETIPKIL